MLKLEFCLSSLSLSLSRELSGRQSRYSPDTPFHLVFICAFDFFPRQLPSHELKKQVAETKLILGTGLSWHKQKVKLINITYGIDSQLSKYTTKRMIEIVW